MEQISQNKLEQLIEASLLNHVCIVSINPRIRGSRYSFTPLYDCADGVGEPQVIGFRNGHYAGVLLMPKGESSNAYFTVLEGDINAAIKDTEIIMSLINSNALFPERRPSKIIFGDEIKERNL